MSLIFELSKKGLKGFQAPPLDVPRQKTDLPENLKRKTPLRLPEVAENQVVRHYINLSVKNHHVDKDFYPLGSCTMKYNPKINDEIAAHPGFAALHPKQPTGTVQGALQVMHELSEALCQITGMDAVTLQPSAGAQGELTALLMFRAYLIKRDGHPRRKIIIPDSAHGTNPASIATAGYDVVQVVSGSDGLVDLDSLKQVLDENTAALMITNPNTLGLFESKIAEITSRVHDAGALVYMDGANLNALMGIARPGDMGFDACHLNLHKTFSTPHGGGGPGSGPVVIRKFLEPFLPKPVLKIKDDIFFWDWERPDSIGHIHGFYGNFSIMVRALAYILAMGSDGLRAVSENAIINANYLRVRLAEYFDLPYNRLCMHEVVFSGSRQKTHGVKTLDMAKRLLDFGFHPPTVYFPLIVSEALMIEPTETESKETMDRFVNAMKRIAKEAETEPEQLKNAPTTTPVQRLDEVAAARNLDINYFAQLKNSD
ncbi:aminomethyl-transferring glycine dehydrogenase subunit GcvPB [bacterium]|nr:aminomethyl-transferring glycine dehydrogenase subunit GcvPB [bacterium]